MTKLNVNIGLSVNDKTGDTLRSAFDKINQNFTELYTLTGGTSTALIELAQDYAAPLFNHASHTNITVTYDDANNKILLTGVAAQVQSNWTASSGLGVILNKPALFSGSYTDLTNKPTIPAAQIQSDWNVTDNTLKSYIANKPTIPTSFSSLVNGSKTVSLASTGTLTLPAPLVHLTNASQLATNTAKIYRATNSTDPAAIQTAWDTWYGDELMFRTLVDQDEQGGGGNYPWHGLPSWEAYPLIMNYLSNPPGGSQLPPNPSLAPTAKTASDSYLSYKELVSSIDIVNGNKTISFDNTGGLSLPGTLEFKDTANAKIILKNIDSYGYVVEDPTQDKTWTFGADGVLTVPGIITKANTLQITSSGATNAAAVIASGDYGRVTLRTDNGTTNKDWYFNIDGVLTTAGSVKLPNNSELRPSTAAYDSALASWEYIRSGEITDRITNNLATAEGWPMVNWHPTGLTAQSYIDFLLNAWTVQNTQGATLIVYPAMSSSFYQQIRAILINIRDNYSLTSSGVSISSGYAKSWNFNEDGKLTFPDGTSQTGAGVQSIHGSLTTANAGGYTVTRNGLTVSIVWDNTSGVAGIIKIAFDSNINVTERTVTLRASSQVNSSYIGTNTALTANQAYTIATLTNLGDFSTTHIITSNYNIYRITTVLQQADAPGGNPVAAGYATIEQLR